MNVDKAVKYHRLKRRAAVCATSLSAALLAAMMWTGASAGLRDLSTAVAAAEHTGTSSPFVIAVYVLLLCVCLHAATLPLAYYSGVVLERRYGLSAETRGTWVRDQAKTALLSTVLAVAGAEFVYWVIRRWPDLWWVVATIGCAFAMLVLTRLAPVVVLPLFYRCKPLENSGLQIRLRALADRARMPVLGAYEWGLGEKSRRANAALVGVGATRRILLSDTLLADYSDEEIAVILAHELGHHAHRDMLKALAAQTLSLLLGFSLGAAVLAIVPAVEPRLGVQAPGDVAGLPLLLVAIGAVSVALTPVINGLSRHHERRADAFALRLTGQPEAFISAMRRLGAQNLVEQQPSRAALWLFHSHPPIEERIAYARRSTDDQRLSDWRPTTSDSD